MSDGLPWPFPWSLPNATVSLSSARSMGLLNASIDPTLSKNEEPFTTTMVAAADALSRRFGKSLPSAISSELYLIQGLSNQTPLPMAVNAADPVVIYPPEFLFVLDVGLEHLIGGSVIWESAGQYGDPRFPSMKAIAVRSIRERTYRGLVFPSIAGSLMIGLVDGVMFPDIAQKLTDFGLKDVQGSGFFITATCAPFEEATVCRNLETTFEFVKYAEMNNVVRIIDFSPGWSLTRLL